MCAHIASLRKYAQKKVSFGSSVLIKEQNSTMNSKNPVRSLWQSTHSIWWSSVENDLPNVQYCWYNRIKRVQSQIISFCSALPFLDYVKVLIYLIFVSSSCVLIAYIGENIKLSFKKIHSLNKNMKIISCLL